MVLLSIYCDHFSKRCGQEKRQITNEPIEITKYQDGQQQTHKHSQELEQNVINCSAYIYYSYCMFSICRARDAQDTTLLWIHFGLHGTTEFIWHKNVNICLEKGHIIYSGTEG